MRHGVSLPFLAFLVFALLVSCSREPLPVSTPDGVPVTFRASGATRADIAGDGTGALSAYVFRSGGVLDVRAAAADTALTVSVPADMSLDYCLVSNPPEGLGAGMMTLSQLGGFVCTLESQARRHTAVAVRRCAVFTGSAVVCDTVRRLVSRVVLGTVTSVLPVREAELVSVFLTNVVGARTLFGAMPAAPVWHNRMGRGEKDGALASLLDLDVREELLRDVSMPIDAVFTFLPNEVEEDVFFTTHPEWSPRPTRLVLEVVADGVRQWYPITLPAVAAGTQITITGLTLFGPGAGHPDIPVDRMSVRFGIEITPWKSMEAEVNF